MKSVSVLFLASAAMMIAPPTALAADNFILHTVVSGNSLYALQQQYDTTIDDIKVCNDMTNNNLSAGQVLRIPKSNQYGTRGICIKTTDSWANIATTYKMKSKYIALLSGKDENVVLEPKECVVVPKIPSDPQFHFQTMAYNIPTNDGMEIASMASQFKTTVKTIRELNGIAITATTTLLPSTQTYLLHDGPTRVLTPVTKATKYVFGNGDTIEMVAEKYQVDVDVLKIINNIPTTTTNLTPGQWLHIPLSNKELKETITEVKATAYIPNCSDGCSGVTATGISFNGDDNAQNDGMRLIAVDPTIIPLGSVVHVEGYGYAAAWDTGGAIKGKKIDVLMMEYDDAIQWGIKYPKVDVYQGKAGNDVIDDGDDEGDSSGVGMGFVGVAVLGAVGMLALLF